MAMLNWFHRLCSIVLGPPAQGLKNEHVQVPWSSSIRFR
jgi:hypothetical protein